ncbi:MAG: AAA family ATPase [Thermoleophilia bacterium]|nr:AAA family ATPase [Thermoleophilia bacterium]
MLRRLRIENLVLIQAAELELAPGLNAITGETGAGKTILAQAVGLLLGAKGEAGYVGAGGDEAYVEAELELPGGVLDEEGLESLVELRPADEEGLVLARRVFADGRTRAYAWGRASAREDVAALAERLVAMSGQFEQRRLARPSYQLDVLDAFAGEEQLRRRAELRSAWRELQDARRRLSGAADAAGRLEELRRLAEDADGLEPGAEEELLAERARLRHAVEIAEAAGSAADAVQPEDGEGAAGLAALGARSLASVEGLAPELARAAEELRDAEVRLREAASGLRAFLAALDAEPGRLERVEGELDRIGETKRRHRSASYEELLARAAEARAALAGEEDPGAAAREAVAQAEQRVAAVSSALAASRRTAAPTFAEAVAAELRDLGLGEGEFACVLEPREPSATGTDAVRFLIRPNPGLPLAPVAETASGGELSRIALAIAAVAGGTTLVFDELDAGIGGRTANAVGAALRRLAERAQVLTITHLPQIASVADRHFRVEKVPGDPTRTHIEQLDDASRRDELERMLGGEEFLQTVRSG